MPTTSYGHELQIGHDTQTGDTPVCCRQDMTVATDSRHYQDWTCARCTTVLTINPNGVVFDIRDAARR